MSSKKSRSVVSIVIFAVFCAVVLFFMSKAYDASESVRRVFSNAKPQEEVVGNLPPDSPDSFANRELRAGRVSMYIFTVITLMQFAALGAAWYVISGISEEDSSGKIKLKKLENADVFFDTPLYIGLFGTVSAFLIMTFSPQSSRVIAYSSTLIGIIFSLILRLTMLYPLRQKLLNAQVESKED